MACLERQCRKSRDRHGDARDHAHGSGRQATENANEAEGGQHDGGDGATLVSLRLRHYLNAHSVGSEGDDAVLAEIVPFPLLELSSLVGRKGLQLILKILVLFTGES